jgi:hypothetical protein
MKVETKKSHAIKVTTRKVGSIKSVGKMEKDFGCDGMRFIMVV